MPPALSPVNALPLSLANIIDRCFANIDLEAILIALDANVAFPTDTSSAHLLSTVVTLFPCDHLSSTDTDIKVASSLPFMRCCSCSLINVVVASLPHSHHSIHDDLEVTPSLPNVDCRSIATQSIGLQLLILTIFFSRL